MTLGNDDCNNGPARPAATSPTMLDTSPTPTSIPLTLQLSKAQRLSIPGTPERKYNTENLPWRIASDLTAATCAALLVAPLITIIDKGIIENASGRRSLRASLLSSAQQLLTRPHIFLTALPFRLITALYLGTYTTANTIDTISATLKPAGTSVSGTTSGPAKFLATTSVNMSLCLYKDSKFARLFGPPGSVPGSGVVPKASYALFALRDSLTIFASFNLPPLLAPVIPLGKELEKSISRVSVAQFLAPAGIQLLSTPLHLGDGGVGGSDEEGEEGLVGEQFCEDGQDCAGLWGGGGG
ncbi:hypothetical protein MMC06_003312 [Schaereria dolodes]|nr:hypothetical protein [Schaereria dolodes]